MSLPWSGLNRFLKTVHVYKSRTWPSSFLHWLDLQEHDNFDHNIQSPCYCVLENTEYTGWDNIAQSNNRCAHNHRNFGQKYSFGLCRYHFTSPCIQT